MPVEEAYSKSDRDRPGGDVGQLLRNGNHYFPHTSDDHYGEVWFEGGVFYEMVMQDGKHTDTLEGKTLQEVLDSVNARFGSD